MNIFWRRQQAFVRASYRKQKIFDHKTRQQSLYMID